MNWGEVLTSVFPELIAGILTAAVLGIIAFAFSRFRPQKERKSDLDYLIERIKNTFNRNNSDKTHNIRSNLPGIPVWVGRQKEIQQVLDGLLTEFQVTAIQGIGGLGKTTIALASAHICHQESQKKLQTKRISRLFKKKTGVYPHFDAFVWLDLKQNTTLANVVETLAIVLEQSEILRLDLDRRLMEIVQLLHRNKALIIADGLDNTVDEALANFMLGIPSPSKVLITTRRKFLLGTWVVGLDGLTLSEVKELVDLESKRLGMPELMNLNAEVISKLRAGTGGVPLGIKWIMAYVKQRGYRLDRAIKEVFEGKADLYKGILNETWGGLPDGCKKTLSVLAMLSGPALLETIAYCRSIDVEDAQKEIGQLIELSLIEQFLYQTINLVKYRLHALTEHFVIAQPEYSEYYSVSYNKMIQYYENYLSKYGGHKNWQGFNKIEEDLENIRAILDSNLHQTMPSKFIKLVFLMSYFLAIRGYWPDYEKYSTLSIQVSENIKDDLSRAHAQMLLAWLLRKRGDVSYSLELIESSNQIFDILQDDAGIAWSTREIGAVAETKENFDIAKEYYLKSLNHWKKINRLDQISHLLKDLGELSRKAGSLEEAKGYILESLKIEGELKNSVAIANRTSKLGQIAFALNDLVEAEMLIRQGLDLHKQMQNHVSEAIDIWFLAQIEEKRGNIDMALDLARQAYAIFVQLNARDEHRMLDTILTTIRRLTTKKKPFWRLN